MNTPLLLRRPEGPTLWGSGVRSVHSNRYRHDSRAARPSGVEPSR